MKLLGIDFETTDKDPLECDVIEIGAVVWDVARKEPKQMFMRLVQTDKEIAPEAQSKHGISKEMLSEGLTQERLRSLLTMHVSFADNHLAKERGYHWVPERKSWVKEMRLHKAEAELKSAPFSGAIRHFES